MSTPTMRDAMDELERGRMILSERELDNFIQRREGHFNNKLIAKLEQSEWNSQYLSDIRKSIYRDENNQFSKDALLHFFEVGNHLIEEERFYSEMAQIYPKYVVEQRPKIQFGVWVLQGGEGIVPHVHVYFGKESNKNTEVSHICLHEATYAPQHDNTKKLISEEKKELIYFFHHIRKAKGGEERTCWQEAVDIWIDTYDDTLFHRDEKGVIIMPDYNKL